MTGTVMMERPTSGVTGVGTGPITGATPATAPNMVMVPRCTFKVEKVTNGMKITCTCPDATSCTMVQNLCAMLAGGMCTVCCTLNGVVVCTCNLTCGICKVETTKDGCCVTCTSGDKACCELIQGCCDCLAACLKAGCTCCLLMNNTPVCCGCC